MVDKFQPKAAQLKLITFKCTIGTELMGLAFLEPISICPSDLLIPGNFGFFLKLLSFCGKTQISGEGGEDGASSLWQLVGPSGCCIPTIWHIGMPWHPQLSWGLLQAQIVRAEAERMSKGPELLLLSMRRS